MIEAGAANLAALYAQVDRTDRDAGLVAYSRYHEMMRRLSEHYATPLDRVCAVFAATSPNNDYHGNLRSTVSILDAHMRGLDREGTTVSTYQHCRDRAFTYLDGTGDFERDVRGPKIRAFYRNVLDPSDPKHVTIDGHMVGAYRGVKLTMKELIVRPREYATIAALVMALAAGAGLVPNQVQAMLWFARKRTLRIRYSSQLSLLCEENDPWRLLHDAIVVMPFPRRDAVRPVGLPRPPLTGLLGTHPDQTAMDLLGTLPTHSRASRRR